jgi:hypothetical protein
MSAHRDVGFAPLRPGAPPERQIGVAAVAVAVIALFVGYVVDNNESADGDVVGWIIASAIAAAVAAFVFLWLIPRAKSDPANTNRPATYGLVISVLGLVAIVVFWLGLPYVLGAGGAVLGRIGQAWSTEAGHGRRATAAVIIGILAVVAALAITAVDAAI